MGCIEWINIKKDSKHELGETPRMQYGAQWVNPLDRSDTPEWADGTRKFMRR